MVGGWYFGTIFSLLVVSLVTIVLFVYMWLRSHGASHVTRGYVTGTHVDTMAGDEGED